MTGGRLAGNLAAIAAAILWGGVTVATRAVVADVPPLLLAAIRYSVGTAAVLLVVRAFAPENLRVSRGEVLRLMLLGVPLFFVAPIAFNFGMRLTEASRGALMLATGSLWSMCFAWLTGSERLTRRQVLGVALTLLGVGSVLGERILALGTGSALLGDGLVLVAAVGFATYAVGAKRALRRVRPLTLAVYAQLGGTLLLIPLGAVEAAMLPPVVFTLRTVCILLFLGLLGTSLIFFMWNFALVRLSPTQVQVYMNLNPITATLLGALLLGEVPRASFMVGATLTLAGVFLVNMPTRRVGARLPPTPAARVALSAK